MAKIQVRKYILYFLLIVAIGVSGYFGYERWFSNKSIDVWDLVPENSIAVYETNGAALIWNDFIQTSLWKNLKGVDAYKEKEKGIILLDSLTGGNGRLDKLTRQSSLLVSFHQISKTNTDAIFYLPLKLPQDLSLLSEVIDKVSKKKNITYSERDYQEFHIREMNDETEKRKFSFIVVDNFFVASFTPFLIEDVVRTVLDGENFKSKNKDLFPISKLNNDKGNLYLNYPQFNELFTKYFQNQNNQFALSIVNFMSNSFLDVTFDDQNILLNGFSFTGDEPTYLKTFQELEPQESKITSIVPSRTALLFQIGIGDGQAWSSNIQHFWESNKAASGNWNELSDKYNFQRDRFFSWLGPTIGLSILEQANKQKEDAILFLESKDINDALNQFNILAEKANQLVSDTLYYEEFSNYKLTQLNIPHFPEKVFGKSFGGFDEVFYMVLDNFIVVSNSVENLKNLIIDVESENTWGKNISYNSFMGTTLEKFNISLMMDMPKVLELFSHNATPDIKSLVNKNGRAIKSFDKVAIQFRAQGDKFYTSISVHNTGNRNSKPEIDFENVQSTQIQNKIATKPFIVRNHINKSLEVLIQDESKILSMINSHNEIQWKDTLPGLIKGEIEQIDYFKNGKLQYLFNVDSDFHLIDRNGKEMQGFPFGLGFEPLNWKLIDYDRSKNYRILVSDRSGNLFLYNKDGTLLEGWTPRKLTGRLGLEPMHLRIRGKDLIIAIQEDGIVNALTRRGEMYKGFPIDLKARTNNEIFVQPGGDFNSTILTTVTNEGEIIKFNLEGKVVDSDQLFKPSPLTTFKIVIEKQGRNFVIVQQDGGRVSILDKNGVLIFEKDYLSSTSLDAQYYDFGSGRKLYIINDPEQEFTYIYQENGKLINSRPLESGHQIGVLYFESLNKFHIYSVFRDHFNISGFFAQ